MLVRCGNLVASKKLPGMLYATDMPYIDFATSLGEELM